MVIRRKSGRVIELSTVWAGSNTRPRRNRRKGVTSAQKQDENERDCVKRLARAINCNFAHGDLWLTPKYDEAGMERLEAWAGEHREEAASWEDAMMDAAEREGRNYLRRLIRALRKAGVRDVKYILSTADRDGTSGEAVRIHHHLILPRVGFELAARLWTMGTVDYQILRAQDDYTPLAEYICRQVRRRPDAKKYTCSRNLDKPVVSQRWAGPGEELRPDRGGKLIHRNEWEPGRPQYIRFVAAEPRKRKPSGAPELSDTTRRAGTGAGGRGTPVGKRDPAGREGGAAGGA